MEQARKNVRLERTPNAERLLHVLRSRAVRQVFLHGLGTMLLVGSAWLAFAYIADWGLRVPKLVRVFHGFVFLGLVAFFVWRELLRPLRRLPEQSGLAVLIERANPDLRELLVSAVQFQERGAEADGDPELIGLVYAEADERAKTLDVRGVLEEESPRARFFLGSGSLAVIALLAFMNPGLVRIFFDRMFGGDAMWPQRTHLVLELPGLDAVARIDGSERIQLRIARGTDVPILVRAEGVVPDEIRLHFSGSRDQVVNSSGGNLFRTLLRSCQEDISFHVTGGDDTDGLPRVEVEVLQPPDVEGVAVAVMPPDYSGLSPTTVFNRDVEVLAGSQLEVHVQPFPADAVGNARVLPDDVLYPLVPAAFPLDPELGDEIGSREGLAFELLAEKSIGYRVELTDATGLTNPDPGLYRIQVVEDRPPEIQVLAPGRTDFEIVRGGAIPLRARVVDDFGIVAMSWQAVVGMPGADEEPKIALSGDFVLKEVLPKDESTAAEHDPAALGAIRLEVDGLGTPDHPVTVDQRYLLEIVAQDNREPQAGIGRALPVRARVVTPEELLRRMQDRLAQARLDAIRLSDLQREKRQRTDELHLAYQDDETSQMAEALALTAVLSGQRRVLGDSQALAIDLAAIAEDILYARLDEKAGALLNYYDARMSEITDLRFHSEPWRDLAEASNSGQLGASGFADNLVELVALALEITDDLVRTAVRELAEAEKAITPAEREAALARASEWQSRSLARMEDLLEELAEWDNFQNILALTRDILNRQKALRERTQKFASDR